VLTAFPVASNLSLLTWIVIAQAVAATLLGMALESILAHATSPEEKGKASGWFQAGNLAGSAIGGAAGLWLIDHMQAWQAGAILAAVGLTFGMGTFFLPDVPALGGSVGAAVKSLLRDLWGILSSRRGIIGVIMFAAPIGTGVINFAATGGDWGASHGTIELLNGPLSTPIVILGCVLGGLLSDRMDRAFAYVAMSMAMIGVTIVMALSPHTPAMYVVYVLAYTLTSGLCFGTYGGFVLDAAGTGAVATKYNILASFANLPIWYMGLGDGKAYDRWHANGMLWFDGLLGIAGCVLVSALIVGFRRFGRRPADVPIVTAGA
jgi:MFS family permease